MNLSEFKYGETERDQAFDPFRRFSPREMASVGEVFSHLCLEAAKRKRKIREGDLDRFKLVIGTAIANAFRASESEPSKKVYYSRKTETYTRKGLYSSASLAYTNLMNAIDGLAELSFVKSERAASQKSSFRVRGAKQSAFEATEKLLEALQRLGVSASDLVRDPNAPVVILKDCEKKLQPYDPEEPLIRSLTSTIKDYNAFLEGTEIKLDVSDNELAAMRQSIKGRKPRPPLNFNDVPLRRIFNNGSFDEGGRWYGGWWQVIPSDYRHRILIDGEAVEELDYSGCFPRMLYHEERIDNRDDLYDIPEIRAAADRQGLNWESVRDSIKVLVNILINANKDDKINRISDLCLPKRFKNLKKVVYPLIAKKHGPISRWFRSGAGLWLMNKESAICEAILVEGLANSIPVLPIHDSFLVPSKFSPWLREAMLSCYRDELGFDPIIKSKTAKGDEGKHRLMTDPASLIAEPVNTPTKEETVTGPIFHKGIRIWNGHEYADWVSRGAPTEEQYELER